MLILHWLLAKLGLSSAICWLGADSLLVYNSPRPSNRSSAPLGLAGLGISLCETATHGLAMVELSTTFLLIGNIAKVSCLISLQSISKNTNL
jgi:hypothetical protein